MPPATVNLERDDRFAGKIKWYVKSVIFGGDPQIGDNLMWVSHEEHAPAGPVAEQVLPRSQGSYLKAQPVACGNASAVPRIADKVDAQVEVVGLVPVCDLSRCSSQYRPSSVARTGFAEW
jgi:hypothetical protein